MTPHLRPGARYVVRRFHSASGQTLQRGQRLELVRVSASDGERHSFTEFTFRDVTTGAVHAYVVNGPAGPDAGRDLFDDDTAARGQ